jgi:Glycosyl hydrolase family 26
VAVLWAPFHEVQLKGWFWWAKGSGAQFVSLWKFEFDYLTKTKGLNNLVWLLPFSGSPSSPYFPGKEYVDISGPDTYGNDQPFTKLFTSAKGVVGATVPIPLHETGRIPTPAMMFPNAAPWVLFNVWAGYQRDGSHNDIANIKSVYADAHTVTRDEVPNLK